LRSLRHQRIHQHQVNLAKPKEVARWVEEFSETYDNLDVLIHNAASMVPQRVIDEDDIESNFAVNTLAVHLITTSLLPLLRKSKDPRVITVSNAGMLLVKLDPHDLNFEDMNPFSGPLSYSQTKRQQIAMNFAYAQRHEGIKFFCMHPGWVDTPGLQNTLPDIYELVG
ncbi:UNVERIFIED_CONTAM: hypothetical protein GTU68_036065, partial [Idotea baltica]|nr:hypothetical protein [Idotea baltica]